MNDYLTPSRDRLIVIWLRAGTSEGLSDSEQGPVKGYFTEQGTVKGYRNQSEDKWRVFWLRAGTSEGLSDRAGTSEGLSESEQG